MRPGDRGAQRKAEPSTAVLRGSRAVRPGKSSEQARAIFWSHARTLIGHFHVPASVRGITPQHDRCPLGGVPEGVFDQVVQHPAQQHGIGGHAARVRSADVKPGPAFDRDALPAGGGLV